LQPLCNRHQHLPTSKCSKVFCPCQPTFSTESKRSSTPACFSSNTWEYREWAMDANCKREYVEHVQADIHWTWLYHQTLPWCFGLNSLCSKC
jgi:hypothetical protein